MSVDCKATEELYFSCSSERKNVNFIRDNFVLTACTGSMIYKGIPRLRDLTEIQCRIRETLTGYGIWLLLRKRDSPKFGHGCRIGKENDIRVCTGSGRVFSHEIQAGFGKTPNFFYAIRELTATREEGFAKNWKKTVFGIEMTDVRGTGLWWKRAEIRDQNPSPPLPASW